MMTREAFEEAFKAMIDWKPPPPCGSEKRPHLTRPAEAGETVRCVQCGHIVTLVGDGRCTDYVVE